MGIDGEKIVGVNEGKNPHYPFDEPDPTGPSLARKICGICMQKQENREEKCNLSPQDRFHIKKTTKLQIFKFKQKMINLK